jgi:hypothetical protein
MKGRLLLLIGGVAAIAGCGDPTGFTANLDTVDTQFAVFAFSGTPLSAPSAVNVFGATPVLTDGSANYDLVFDIRGGQAVVLPPRVVGGLATAGIQTLDEPFESVLVAPGGGYNDSTAVPIDVGDVLAIRAQPQPCANTFGLRPFIYAKALVIAINTSDTATMGPDGLPPRSLRIRMVVDPNCSFRSLAPGLPTS